MLNKKQAYRLVPWAWFVAWTLTGMGAVLSDIYSSPSNSLLAYFTLSALGWAMAAYLTASASTGKSGMAVQLAAWGIAYLVAIPLGIVWMRSGDKFPFLFSVPYVLAGSIGGIASAARPGVGRWISGVLVGFLFILFSPIITFYAGLIILEIYSITINRNGSPLSSSYTWVWALPNALFGLAVGFALRWILGFKAGDTKGVST
jgi:hypothetical protein